MFFHNFKYTFKALLKDRPLIFWTYAFPLILATFFNMAFSNLVSGEALDVINIAVVDDEEFEDSRVLPAVLEELSDPEGENRLFETVYTSKEEAEELLRSDEISAYLRVENGKPIITASESGVDQTVLKYVTEEIIQTEEVAYDIVAQKIEEEINAGNYDIGYEEVHSAVSVLFEYEESGINDLSSSDMDYTMIEFYSLIAMSCMYGGLIGMVAVNQSLANMSEKGKRKAVAPVKRGSLIAGGLLASYIIQLIGIVLLYAYTIIVLNVDYGRSVWAVILLSLVGSFAGLALGVFIAAVFKVSEGAKTGIMIAASMTGSFFAGMFGVSMKYIIDKNMPLINRINPVGMITDGLYSLYYYDTLERYWSNIAGLLIFACVLILISVFELRRQKYDSI